MPSTYSGEIAYGYDVLEGDYYNVEDVKTCSIFNIDKMIQDGLILTDQAGYTENYTTTNAGKSTSEYSKSFSASLGVEYNAIFFSAGLQVDFSASGKITSNTFFAKFNSYLQTQMDKLNSTGLSCQILGEKICV